MSPTLKALLVLTIVAIVWALREDRRWMKLFRRESKTLEDPHPSTARGLFDPRKIEQTGRSRPL